ncbi:MAG TPA: hypothetical protein VHO69_11205, partial [Phototrophicaceae bacterium]|nr:hypothetical protein [Phototrophicaceae bacterium]
GEDQPIQIGLPGAVLDLGGTLSVGKLYGLSAAAAGGIAPVDDIDTSTYVTFLGGATATNRFIFQPLTLGVLAAAVLA